MQNLTKSQRAKLSQHMPDFKSELDKKLQKLLMRVEAEFTKGLAVYVSKKYLSFKNVLSDVLLHTEEGYTIDFDKSHSAPAANGAPTYVVYFKKPQKILEKEKKNAIESAKEAIKQELEALENQWLEQELEQLREHQKKLVELEKQKQEQEDKFKLLEGFL